MLSTDAFEVRGARAAALFTFIALLRVKPSKMESKEVVYTVATAELIDGIVSWFVWIRYPCRLSMLKGLLYSGIWVDT